MADTKISAATDAGTLLATDMLPLARSGSTSAYHATMTEIGAFTNATLPVASTTTAGVVKVDGSTITIASGVISGVSPAPYGSLPAMDGTANAGAVSAWSRGDHVHPIDTSRAPLVSPALTGAPTAPTPTTGDNSTKLATTAFVQAQMVASGAGVSSWNSRAGAVVLQQSDLVAQGGFHDTGRNLVMNGAFAVQQRGAGPWTTDVYTADRWQINHFIDTFSVSVIALADADRTGIGDESARYALQNAFTGSATANSYNDLVQSIEDVRRLGNKTVTLSFWAKASSGTPRMTMFLLQFFGTGGSPSAVASVAIGPTPALSTAWTRYTFNATMPSVAGKTLGTNGDSATQLRFRFSEQGGTIGVQSGTIQLYGIQLEVGTQATPFDAGGTPADQLRQCQRFYQVISATGGAGYSVAGTVVQVYLEYPQMRATPTATPTWGTNTNYSPTATPQGNGLLVSGTASATGQWGFNLTFCTLSADL